jgi:hypothetical protein
MTKHQAAELREKWKQQVDRQPCQHLEQEVDRGEKGIVTATYYCLTCGKAVLRIYRDNSVKRLHLLKS